MLPPPMPKMPPTHDPRGRTAAQRDQERRRTHDARRAVEKPWRKLYQTPEWKALRRYVLDRDPFCLMCLTEGVCTESTVADHIRAHEGDLALFLDPLNCQGLCKPHHDSAKQRMENEARTHSVRSKRPNK